MFKKILSAFNLVPRDLRTLSVCATALLMAACASNNDYSSDNSHNPSNMRKDSSYNSSRSHSKDVWQRVRDNFGMPDLINDEVSRKEDYYATRADYVGRMASRSGDFLPLIMNEVEKRRMPSEIALLPFVESAFVTTASSPVKASGLWQFMPATGRDFSLEQNRFADQRNDVVASTDAALTFLQRLHDQFGDWHLALAAYNWGPGNVTKAVNRAQAAGLAGTYEDIRMPLETKQYVPKLQAIKNIVSNPARFGISLPDVATDSRHEVVSITRDIDLTKAAELSGLDLESFKRINPAFKKPVIAAALGSRILVPANRADAVRNALSDRSSTLATMTTYSTYNTEALADIAAQFNTTEDNLRYLNNIPPYHSYVKAGSSLLVPRTSNKTSQDIPYQALSAGLTTTTGGIGFGTNYTVEQPVLAFNSDDTTRQERSGIANAAALFASTSPSNTGPGLSFSSSSDDLAQLIKNNPNSLHDPVAASGALIVNATPRKVVQPINLAQQPTDSNNAPAIAPNLFNTLAASSTAPVTPATTPTPPLPFEPQPIAVAVTATPNVISPPKAVNVPLSSLNAVPTTAPITPILVNTPPAITATATPINDSLTPFSPDAFKAIESENTLAEHNVEPEKPVVKVAAAPIIRKINIADIKPAAKPLVATSTNQTTGKVVKVNYAPPVAAKVVNTPAKPSTKPSTKSAITTKQIAPAIKTSTTSKEKVNAVTSKAPTKTTATANVKTTVKESLKNSDPATPSKGKGKVTPPIVANKPAEKPNKSTNNTVQKANVKNDKTPPAPKPQANNSKPAILEKKGADKSKTAAKTSATETDKKTKPIKKN